MYGSDKNIFPAQLGPRDAKLYLQLHTLLPKYVFLQLLDLDGSLLGVQEAVGVGKGEPGRGEDGKGEAGQGPDTGLSLQRYLTQ